MRMGGGLEVGLEIEFSHIANDLIDHAYIVKSQ